MYARTYLIGSLALAMALSATAHAQTVKDSVITVEELLKIDNAQALKKTTEDAIKAGVLEPPKAVGTTKEEVPLPRWTVLSISGLGNALTADLKMDDTVASGVTAGTKVGVCEIVRVENTCVTLKGAGKKVRKGECPASVCWTGEELALELAPPQQQPAAPSQQAGKPLPAPLPAAPMPLPAAQAANVKR